MAEGPAVGAGLSLRPPGTLARAGLGAGVATGVTTHSGHSTSSVRIRLARSTVSPPGEVGRRREVGRAGRTAARAGEAGRGRTWALELQGRDRVGAWSLV